MNIKDGSVTWTVRDKRIKALVDLFFPVGSIIARDDDTEPEILSYGKWEKIGENRVLQGAGGDRLAGSDVEAGLPNVYGYIEARKWETGSNIFSSDGKLFTVSDSTNTNNSGSITEKVQKLDRAEFDASKYNPIYGNSDTVQPPAHIVTFWKRIE